MRHRAKRCESILCCALCLTAAGAAPGHAEIVFDPRPAAPAKPSAGAQEAAEMVLTLADAQAEALRNNRQVRTAEVEIRRRQSEWKAARAQRYPSIQAGALGSYQAARSGGIDTDKISTVPGLGVSPLFQGGDDRGNAFLGLSISQPVLGLHTINLKARLQHAEMETAREQLRQSEQETVASVSRAYYQLVAIQSAADANEEAIRYYRETERMTSAQVREQAALRAGLLLVQAQLAEEERQGVQLRNSLESGREQVNLLLGRDVRTRFRVSAPAEEPGTSDPGALDTLQNEALRRRPELGQASLAVRKAELGHRLARAEFRPELNVGITYLRSFGADVLPDNSASVGLFYRAEVFDWGRRRHQLAARERAVDQAKIGLDDTRDRVLLDVSAQYRGLQNAQAQRRAAEAAQAAASEQVRNALAQYRERAVTLSDLLKTQSSLAEANAQRQQAFSAYLTAAAELTRAIGGK